MNDIAGSSEERYYIARYLDNGNTLFWSKSGGWTENIDDAWSTLDKYEAKPLADAHNAKVHPVMSTLISKELFDAMLAALKLAQGGIRSRIHKDGHLALTPAESRASAMIDKAVEAAERVS